MRMRVSLCMIARNEALTLAKCLTSIADLVDEIIVVDTGSDDDTCAVASQFGATVHEFAWVDDFAAARNESLRHATGDWVLWLDGDEHLDADNRVRLRALLDDLDDGNAAYLMSQRSLAAHAKGKPCFLSAGCFVTFRLFAGVIGFTNRSSQPSNGPADRCERRESGSSTRGTTTQPSTVASSSAT